MESSAETRFREYLRDQGLRLTDERRTILSEVFHIHEHFEAEEVVSRLRGRGVAVSRASVYRALPLLVESGLLREVSAGQRHSHYEHVHAHEHHDHLVCVQCARIIEFNDPALERLEGEICRRAKFVPRFHRVEIHGVCDECADQESCALAGAR